VRIHKSIVMSAEAVTLIAIGGTALTVPSPAQSATQSKSVAVSYYVSCERLVNFTGNTRISTTQNTCLLESSGGQQLSGLSLSVKVTSPVQQTVQLVWWAGSQSGTVTVTTPYVLTLPASSSSVEVQAGGPTPQGSAVPPRLTLKLLATS
jgi:hypothetical protein